MPLRGSAQLLLLFLARGKRRGMAGALAGGAVAAGLFLGGPAELAQALRERAWDRALAESPAQPSWPWTEASGPAAAKVHRLGLSAAVVKDGSGRAIPALYAPRRPDEAGVSQRPDTMLSELAVGDHITVTGTSGDSRSYRVAGPNVVDPHLAQDDPRAANGEEADRCEPLDPWLARSLRLVIQAITAEPPAPEPGQEQKL
jgi:sortase A